MTLCISLHANGTLSTHAGALPVTASHNQEWRVCMAQEKFCESRMSPEAHGTSILRYDSLSSRSVSSHKH